MQYLNQYFPIMPTWINIQSVMIVRPNGKILSQYRQFSSNNRKKISKKQISSSDNEQKSKLREQSQKQENQQYDQQKKLIKQKLQNISKQVIESSRKLFRNVYEKCLNKLIIDKSLVYYRARYNVLVIVVVKKFSVDVQQIQNLIDKVFLWYSEKCMSMNIEINLPNSKMGPYEQAQFKKLQWEIANQIEQKATIFQISKIPVQPKISKEEFVKERFQSIGQTIESRQDKLKQIGQKVSFDESSVQNSELSPRKESSKLKKFFERLCPKIFSQRLQKQVKNVKFKRQLSFMQKTVTVSKQMKIRLLLFYVCLIVSLTLGTMIYFGWFQQNDQL